MNNHILLILLILLLLPVTSFSRTISGNVISIEDRDTITIFNRQIQKKSKIRLYGIDTPEKGQAFGNKAKQFTAVLVTGKQVIVKVYDKDKYGRSVGLVFVGKTTVNEEIIKNGYAWQKGKYTSRK